MNRFFYPLILTIIAVALYFFYIAPKYQEMKVLVQKEKNFDEALINIREVESTIDQLENSYHGIPREDLIRLEKFMPHEIDIVHTIQTIESIVSSHGASFNPGETTTISNSNDSDSKSKLTEHVFSFDIVSSYEAFRDVLADIEKNLQLADVNDQL